MEYLSCPPQGFYVACEFINLLNEDSLKLFMNNCCEMIFEKKKTGKINESTTININITQEQINSIENALLYITKSSEKTKIDGKELVKLLNEFTDLNENTINNIAIIYHNYLKKELKKQKKIENEESENKDYDNINDIKSVLNLGRLISMNWSTGITLTSSRMKLVKKAFVRLSIKIAHATGIIKTHYVTLSMDQFQVIIFMYIQCFCIIKI